MTTFEDAKVGDRVWCLYFEKWSTITDINMEYKYPIQTDLTSYTIDGRINMESRGRLLFWDEVIITPPEKPLPKLEVDTKVLVWEHGSYKIKAHFSHFDSDNKICVFSLGKTSWTKDNNTQAWTFWELAKD